VLYELLPCWGFVESPLKGKPSSSAKRMYHVDAVQTPSERPCQFRQTNGKEPKNGIAVREPFSGL
jgi:hypothetical protein